MSEETDRAKALQVQDLISKGQIQEAAAVAATISDPAIAELAKTEIAEAEAARDILGAPYPRTSGGPLPPAILQQALEMAQALFPGEISEAFSAKPPSQVLPDTFQSGAASKTASKAAGNVDPSERQTAKESAAAAPEQPPAAASDLAAMSQQELIDHFDRRADELRSETEDSHDFGDTIAVTVVRKRGGGPDTRRVIVTSRADNKTKRGDITLQNGESYVNPGPHIQKRLDADGNPLKDENGRNIEYVVDQDGSERPYNRRTQSEHHAEQRAKRWADDNDYEIEVGPCPTRGCCDGCRAALGPGGLAKIPEHRRSRDGYNERSAQTESGD